jgi:hypothetical protein
MDKEGHMEKDRNLCIVTGLLIDNTRNADNPDIKRPILDFEIAYVNGSDEVSFLKIPVLLSGVAFARSVTKYRIGEICLIEGSLICCGEELCIRADSILSLSSEKGKLPPAYVGRANLIQSKLIPNILYLAGEVREITKDTFTLLVKRSELCPGDLKTEDVFILHADKLPRRKKYVSCLCALSPDGIAAQSILPIAEEDTV